MRLYSRRFFDPSANGFYATTAVALSIFVFAYSTHFGQISILAYYAVWLPLLAWNPRLIVGRPLDLLLPVALVGLMILSFFWSNAPGLSLRGGIQYFTHLLCALVAARVVGFPSFLRGSMIGLFLVVLYSLAFGSYGYDTISGTYTFIGAFGSKNQLGLNCSLGLFLASTWLLTMRGATIARVAVILLLALMAYTLAASRSATSISTVAIALAALIGLIGLLRLSPNHRLGLVVCVLPVLAAMAIAFAQFQGTDAVLAAFGKDSTLTGRTYLWEQGIAAGTDRPLLGLGYQAFWVLGYPPAERLWAEFQIVSRTGFHFHNTYIEVYAELGALGILLLALIVLVTLIKLLLAIAGRKDPLALCYLPLLIMLIGRSFGEVDILYPFSIGGFLIFFMYFQVLAMGRRRPVAAGRRRRSFGRAPFATVFDDLRTDR